MINGLKEIQEEFDNGKVGFKKWVEDIDLKIEDEVIEGVGDGGGKLDRGGSRNEEVGSELDLQVKKEVVEIQEVIR